MTSVIIMACYLSLLLALGLFSHRLFAGTGRDYQLAGHSIGPFMLLMSLFGTTMTAFALIGSTGEAWVEGIGVYGQMASSSGIIHSLCFFLVGVKVWKFGHKYGYTTQIEFFRDRFNSKHIGLVLFPMLVAMVIVYILTGIIGSGTVVTVFSKGAFPELFPGDPARPASVGAVPEWLGSAVICAVVLVYVFYGGMRGTAWANTFQTIVFMILGVVTFLFIASQLGDGGILENMRTVSAAVGEDKTTRAHISKTMFFTYLFIPLSVGMFPHLFQHWLTARSADTFKLAVVAHPIFIMIVWVPCIMLGIWATTDIVHAAVPPLAKLTAEGQNKVLPMLVDRLSTPLLGGFLSAGVLAAIMSSLDSQFLCVGTMFTQDIAKHYFSGDTMSDRATVLLTRTFIVAVVAITYLLTLVMTPSVFGLGVWCFSGFSSLFPLVFGALYWRRMTCFGAYACIAAAAGTWAILFWRALESGRLAGYMIQLPLGGSVYELMPVAAMIVASTTALIVGSLISKPLPEETVRKFFPRG